MFKYILQITDLYREANANIEKFQFVIYSYCGKAKHYFWVDVADLHTFRWVKPEFDKIVAQYKDKLELNSRNLNLALANCIQTSEGKKFSPMVDFNMPSWERAEPTMHISAEMVARFRSQNREIVKMSLALLGTGHGAIVDSGNSYHFFGFELKEKQQWVDFIKDGTWESYGYMFGSKYPDWPKWPYDAAYYIGDSWGRMVTKQNYSAFLRLLPAKHKAMPQMLELFEGGYLLAFPPDDAPCSLAYEKASDEYDLNWDLAEAVAGLGDPAALEGLRQPPSFTHFCSLPCPYESSTVFCPSVRSRTGT